VRNEWIGLDWTDGIKGIPTGLPSEELGIESLNEIQTAPGVMLDAEKKVLVGSVLDVSLSLSSSVKFASLSMELWEDCGS